MSPDGDRTPLAPIPPLAPRPSLAARPSFPPRPSDAPDLGVGVGLRTAHYGDVLARGPRDDLGVDWFELISENYMVPGGRPLRILDEVREVAPVVLHGVSLNVGSTDPLDADHVAALDRLADRARPSWISDHLCWTGVGGTNLHDLLPLPYVDDVVSHVAARVREVQDRLGRRIALENVSSYLSYEIDSMSEWDFVAAVAEEADCGILLDVNNVYVSAQNHGFDATTYVDAMPADRVFQIHLAGHSRSGPMLIDTHDHPVCDAVWQLFERVIARCGPISTLIEWDDRIPGYERLIEEADVARRTIARVTGARRQVDRAT
jgi:uncharacterized protein (UPF0276 family)